MTDQFKDFKKIRLEGKAGNFIPDISLSNENGSTIFFEIKVTHSVSQEKEQSGFKIIEIDARKFDEQIFSILEGNRVSESMKEVKFFNFKIKDRSAYKCDNFCIGQFVCFGIDISGRSSIFILKSSEIICNFLHYENNYKYLGVIEPAKLNGGNISHLEGTLLYHSVVRANLIKQYSQTCYSCKNSLIDPIDEQKTICNIKGVKVDENIAIYCKEYLYEKNKLHERKSNIQINFKLIGIIGPDLNISSLSDSNIINYFK